jgi:DNA segregation ATPase FtsK/SpoIIIE, S-DNA-T family
VPIDVFQDVRVEVRAVVVPEGGELPSDAELEAMAAAERQAAEPDVPHEGPALEELIAEEPEETSADEAGPDGPEATAEPEAEPEPEWRADAEAALGNE